MVKDLKVISLDSEREVRNENVTGGGGGGRKVACHKSHEDNKNLYTSWESVLVW